MNGLNHPWIQFIHSLIFPALLLFAIHILLWVEDNNIIIGSYETWSLDEKNSNKGHLKGPELRTWILQTHIKIHLLCLSLTEQLYQAFNSEPVPFRLLLLFICVVVWCNYHTKMVKHLPTAWLSHESYIHTTEQLQKKQNDPSNFLLTGTYICYSQNLMNA